MHRKIHGVRGERATNRSVCKIHVGDTRIVGRIGFVRDIAGVNDGGGIFGCGEEGGKRNIEANHFIQHARGGIRNSEIGGGALVRSSRSCGNQVTPGAIIIRNTLSRGNPFHVAMLSCARNRVFHALGARNVIDKFVFHFFSDLCAASHSSQVFFGSLYHEEHGKAIYIG